ncbi:MAG: hypothetical protein ACREV7_07205 [Steroidobacteraceae bacterium]
MTTVAAWQKIASVDPAIGLLAAAHELSAHLAAGALAPAAAAVAPQLIFNQRLDAWLTVFFTAVLWLVIIDMGRVCARKLRGLPVPVSSKAPYQAARLRPVSLSAHLPQESST